MEEEVLKKRLEILKNDLNKLQNLINECRYQIINIEKELISDTSIGDVKITFGILKEAKKIYFGEVEIEVNLSARASNAIRRSGKIKTLRDLYELALNGRKYGYIRNLGEKSLMEINSALLDMENVILRIKKRREEVERLDLPLEFLLDERIAKNIQLSYKVGTLRELYDFYAKYTSTYFQNEKEVKALLRDY